MNNAFSVSVDGWSNGAAIPERFAFGKKSPETHIALSDNLNPKISWENAPVGTMSFVILCHDPDVPSSPEDVNKEGRSVPAALPRIDFYHWVLTDIPAHITSIEEGMDSNGVTAKGKPAGARDIGVTGINNYTDWFAGDPDMGGQYAGYDGPCPPWNDSILHHYHFTVYALDVETLDLSDNFGGPEVLEAINGKVLAQDTYIGTYTLNPELKG